MKKRSISIDGKEYKECYSAKMVSVEVVSCDVCYGDMDVICCICGNRPEEDEELLCINDGDLHVCRKCVESNSDRLR